MPLPMPDKRSETLLDSGLASTFLTAGGLGEAGDAGRGEAPPFLEQKLASLR
jgi:hypothetical protein